jgi:hypothetical protein
MAIKMNKLKTIKNFAKAEDVSTSYIYRLIRDAVMDCIIIDGVKFIDTERFPTIPDTIKRR